MKTPTKSFGVPTCRYCGGELDDDTHGVCAECGRKASGYRRGCYIVVSVPPDEDRMWIGGHFKKSPKDKSNTQGLPEGLRLEYWVRGEFAGLFEVKSVLEDVTPKGYAPKGDNVFVGPKAKR